jgi:hypothetical protein
LMTLYGQKLEELREDVGKLDHAIRFGGATR